MQRRQFFSGAAAVASAAFPILGANERVNIGQVGIGGRGRDHIDFYAKADGARIAAVCDVNQAGRERGAAQVQKLFGAAPKQFEDMRAMFESKDIDAVSITTPNHWHALSTIWACQAGKDVYVEKPASHNVFEGHQMVAAARKYNRMVQVGSQSRTTAHKMRAIELLREGVIGQVYHARGLCYRRRFSIGHTPEEKVPPGLDWDRFLGPAPARPYSKNRFAYNWHWFWDTGNGDIGNQGIHEMDVNLWGLGRGGWPVSVVSTGGKYAWKDDQETANTQSASFDFGDAVMSFEVRNLPTPTEGGALIRPNSTGNIFFGETGFMYLDPNGFQVYKSAAASLSHDAVSQAGAGGLEKYEKTMDEKPGPDQRQWDTTPHMNNFLTAVRARDHRKLNADIAIGARSAAFVHLANISMRTGRKLLLQPSTGRISSDPVADSMLTRDYREGYVIGGQV